MRIKDWFTVPEGKRVTEKVFGRVLLSSVCSILLCMVCLASTTWAWFSVSLENKGNEIQIAAATVEVKVNDTVVDANGGIRDLSAGAHTVAVKLASYNGNKPVYVVLAVKSVASEGTENAELNYYWIQAEPEETKITLVTEKTADISYGLSWVEPEGAQPIMAVDDTVSNGDSSSSSTSGSESSSIADNSADSESSSISDSSADSESGSISDSSAGSESSSISDSSADSESSSISGSNSGSNSGAISSSSNSASGSKSDSISDSSSDSEFSNISNSSSNSVSGSESGSFSSSEGDNSGESAGESTSSMDSTDSGTQDTSETNTTAQPPAESSSAVSSVAQSQTETGNPA